MTNYKFELATQTLTVSSAFAKASTNPSTEEYELLKRLMKDFPKLKIKNRTHKTPNKYHTKSGEVFNCNQFKNLKYENIEKFIAGTQNADALMEAYNFIKDNASLVQTSRYTVVRRWFEAQFPEFRKSPLLYLQNETKVIDAKEYLETIKAEIALKKAG